MRIHLQRGLMFFLLISLAYCKVPNAVESFPKNTNYALQFDGIDDKVHIFMDLIPVWTVEAWVKGNDTSWNEKEVVVSNGWFYAVGDIWEDYPLLLQNGKPCVFRSGLTASTPLDKDWHHLAATCDGTVTKLYVDGKEVASANVAKPIGPNFVGSHAGKEFFAGQIDEIRIWNSALTSKEISSWKNKPINTSHPSFNDLLAYYTFDDQALDANDLMLQNLGDIKNDDYYNPEANDPFYVTNNNANFLIPKKQLEVFRSDVIQNNYTLGDDEKNAQILKLKISVQGNEGALKLNQLNLDLSENTSLSDISKVHVYYLGTSPSSANKKEIFGTGKNAARNIVFSEKINNGQPLNPGVNYFEISFELNNKLTIGNKLDAAIPSFQLNGTNYFPKNTTPTGVRKIINGKKDPNIVKTLAYNIWHGGRETGYDRGVKHTIDVIKATKADVVFMIESYGAQKEISDSLGYYMYTTKNKANLSIHSRYPIIETYEPKHSAFQAIGAKLQLDNGRELIVYDVWLRYCKPDYSTEYRSKKGEPAIWVKGDTETGLVDIQNIFAKDIDAVATDPNVPILIGGDFNTASHLDWTEATAPLHGGIGAVDWPVHKYMIDTKGYVDSYRTVYPNPFTHQGSTWAAIFNWSNYLRIDYIYHKGPHVKPIESQVIETHPDVGVMWPSDHSAVLTTYDFSLPKSSEEKE